MAQGDFGVSVRLKRLRIRESDLLAPGSAVYVAADRAGAASRDRVRKKVLAGGNIDSGELYDSIDYEIFRSGKGLSVSVGSAAKHARYVEYGTRSPIPAAGPKRMPIKIKGGPTIIVSRVKGQDAKPYFRDALKEISPDDWR
jgi:hypothetical protein